MPNEYEVERLVVRMVGEDSSYAKMIERNTKSNQELTRMIEQNSEAQKRADSVTKQSTSTWYEYGKSVSGIVRIHDLQVTGINKVKEAAKGAASVVGTLGSETAKLAREEASLAVFGSGKNIFEKIGTALDAKTWQDGITQAFANYRDVTRKRVIDEGDYTRQLTKYEYEREQLMKHEIERGKEFARQERDHQRDLQRQERGRIQDPAAHKAEIEARLKEETKVEEELRARIFNTKTNQGGTTERGRLEQLDAQYFQKAWSATWAKITGGIDEHNRKIEIAKQEIEDLTGRYREQQRVRREMEREQEEFDRRRQHQIQDLTRMPRFGAGTAEQKLRNAMGDLGAPGQFDQANAVRLREERIHDDQALIDSSEDLVKALQKKIKYYDMVGEAARIAQLKEKGQLDLAEKVEQLTEEMTRREHVDRMRDTEKRILGIFGGSRIGAGTQERFEDRRRFEREQRDIDLTQALRKKKVSEDEIRDELAGLHREDRKKDARDASEHVNDFIESLHRQSEALRENKTEMDRDIDALNRLNDVTREQYDEAFKAIEQKRRDRIAREQNEDYNRNLNADIDKANAIREHLKTNAERKADRIKELDRLRYNPDTGISVLDQAEYDKAIAALNKEFNEKKRIERSLGPISAVQAGSAEALSRLDEFYDSLRQPGDFGPSGGGGRRARRQRRTARQKLADQKDAAMLDQVAADAEIGRPPPEEDKVANILDGIAKDMQRVAKSNEELLQDAQRAAKGMQIAGANLQ